jgi:hypothetical protein
MKDVEAGLHVLSAASSNISYMSTSSPNWKYFAQDLLEIKVSTLDSLATRLLGGSSVVDSSSISDTLLGLWGRLGLRGLRSDTFSCLEKTC